MKTEFVVTRDHIPNMFTHEPPVKAGWKVRQKGSDQWAVADEYGRHQGYITRATFQKLSKTALGEKSGQTLLEELGKEIRRARENREMTQMELAGHLGATLQYISNVERGKATISINQLGKIAQVLNFDVRIKYVRRYTSNQCLNTNKGEVKDEN